RPHSRRDFKVLVNSSSIVFFLLRLLQHLVVAGKIRRVGQSALLVGLAVLEALIHFGTRQRHLAALAEQEACDALEGGQIGDPITQRTLHHREEQRSAQTKSSRRKWCRSMPLRDGKTKSR